MLLGCSSQHQTVNIMVPLGDPRDVLFLFWCFACLFFFFPFLFLGCVQFTEARENVLIDVIKSAEQLSPLFI